VANAIFIYNVIVDTGLFNTIRDSLAGVSNDRRIQVVLIAFVFGVLLEATAGFGTPVAITASLMAGLGFEPLYAAALALLANTAPVAFGGFGFPILTGATLAGLNTLELSQMVGRQTPLLALIIPAMLVTVMSGFRRMLEVWPVIAVSGVAFAMTQFLVSNVLGPELADLLASLITVVAVISLLSFWRPSTEWHFENEPSAGERESYQTPLLGRTLLRLVALYHHRRPVSPGAGAPDQGRRRRHPDSRKLSKRGGERDDGTARRAVAGAQRASRAAAPCGSRHRALRRHLLYQLALRGRDDHLDRRPDRPRRPAGRAW
jgi:L-lactate permease